MSKTYNDRMLTPAEVRTEDSEADLDEFLLAHGIDPDSMGEASDEEVERVMKRLYGENYQLPKKN